MTHLTLCGSQAGRVICGAAKTEDNQYLHYIYAPIDKLQRNELSGYGPVCQECMAEVNAAENE